MLNAALGEALLDVERTFMHVVDQQARVQQTPSVGMQGCKYVQAYLDAWGRLNVAHGSFRRYIAGAEDSLEAA